MPFCFIHIFLGLTVLASLTVGDEVIQRVTGEIGGGNYTYYSLKHEGSVILILYSREGDADLYVSENNLKPTFEPENYSLQSVTCGVDRIDIPKTFRQPVGIGVYGHPSYAFSTYTLEVITREDDEINSYTEAEIAHEEKQNVPESPDTVDEEPLLWTVIWSVLEVLFDLLIS